MQTALRPTLWRTCRALANKRRLRVLRQVIADRRLCVSEAARACGLTVGEASESLRLLQSRGLLSVVRHSRWTHYVPEANPGVDAAPEMLHFVLAAIRRKETPDAMLQALTAFTHERRLLIARALARQPATLTEVSARCGISLPAASRHLAKLCRRGVVTDDDGRFALVRSAPGLLGELLRLAAAVP
jgi:DNA-binding transcriptional ArsR family regulator